MEIAIYVEGGGNTTAQKAELRLGFDTLFKNEKERARERRGSLKFVCCGARQEAYEAFLNASRINPQTISVLLVDSESPIAHVPADTNLDSEIRVNHLRQTRGTGGRGQGDGWLLANVSPNRVHLMVQCMETWIVADPDALEMFYQQNFRRERLPQRMNLEEEPKEDVYLKLEKATEGTQKGRYGKISHASKLLAVINPSKIANRCPRFLIFRSWLGEMTANHA